MNRKTDVVIANLKNQLYNRHPAYLFNPFDLLSACFASVVALAVYIYSLAPTITFGDAGELTTAAVTLGVAHPPGYPLWLLMAKLFSLLPIGSVAYRLNLLSAFLDAAAVGLLSLIIAKTLPQVAARIVPAGDQDSPLFGIITGAASATAALSLAFSPAFWQQAIAAEVYPLNNFLMCLILLLMIMWSADPQKNKLLFLTAFLFGIGMGNHQTLALLAPAAALYVVLVRPKAVISPKALIGCSTFFLLGLLIYAYLPIRAFSNPPLNWGDPKTWDNFWFHVLRKQYRSLAMAKSFSVIIGQIKFLFSATLHQFPPVVLLFPALISLVFANKRGRKWLIFIIAAFFCTGVLLMIIANTELDLNAQELLKIYFLPPWIIVAIGIGYGIAILNLLALRGLHRMRRHVAVIMAPAILWLLLPISSIAANYKVCSMRHHDFAKKYGDGLFNSMRAGGILFAGTDSGYAIPMYMKWVAARRPDLTILSVNKLSDRSYQAEARRNSPTIPFLTDGDYTETYSLHAASPGTYGGGVYGAQRVNQLNAYLLLKLYQRIPSERPIYYDQGLPIDWICDYAIPSGLLMEIKGTKVDAITPKTAERDNEYWDSLEKQLLSNKYFLNDSAARAKFSKCRTNIGYLYLRRKMYPEAENALEQAIRFSNLNIEAYAFLALVYKEQGQRDKAISIFNDYLQRDTWNTSARSFARSLEQ